MGRLALVSVDLKKKYGFSVHRPNFCYPNPCQNDGDCENDEKNMTYKCRCRNGATGSRCEHIPDRCAKKNCRGGTCTNTATKAICSCGAYQHWNERKGRCVASNCATHHNLCGKAKCQDNYSGPKCTCAYGYLYYKNLKDCKKDYCNARACGSASCANTAGKPICRCKKDQAYDTRSKKCKSACHKGACPHDAVCTTRLRGSSRTPEKVCRCNNGKLYWGNINKCAWNFCWKYNCGQAKCRNTPYKAVCDCPKGTRFMPNKKCESKRCYTLGRPQWCGNQFPVCAQRGLKA